MGIGSGMAEFEYKVVAAPRKTKSFRGVRSHEDQFAAVLAEMMNELAKDDWEYLRAESLPCEEKTGLTSRVVSYQNMLIFRRRIVAKDQFFETPNPKRIEHHPEAANQNVTSLTAGERMALREMPTDAASEEQAGQASILGILRSRRTREDTPPEAPDRLAAE